jgi:hypothetical protein
MSTQPSVRFSAFLFIYHLVVNVVNTSWQVQGVSNDRMASTQARFDDIWRNNNLAERIHAPHRHRASVRSISLSHASVHLRYHWQATRFNQLSYLHCARRRTVV